MPVHALNIEGVAYRSYRLIEVQHPQWTDKSIRHCAVNKKKKCKFKINSSWSTPCSPEDLRRVVSKPQVQQRVDHTFHHTGNHTR